MAASSRWCCRRCERRRTDDLVSSSVGEGHRPPKLHDKREGPASPSVARPLPNGRGSLSVWRAATVRERLEQWSHGRPKVLFRPCQLGGAPWARLGRERQAEPPAPPSPAMPSPYSAKPAARQASSNAPSAGSRSGAAQRLPSSFSTSSLKRSRSNGLPKAPPT